MSTVSDKDKAPPARAGAHRDEDVPAEVAAARDGLAVLPSEPYQPTTYAERMATIADDAVRADGRLVGVYSDDIAAEYAERVAAQVEGREVRVTDWAGTPEQRAAAAAKVRAAAVGTPALPTSEEAGRVTIHPDAGLSAAESNKKTEAFNKQADAESLAR